MAGESIEQFSSFTDPNFIIAISKELLAVPVLFFVLAVLVIFYFIFRAQHKTIDKKLNGDK